MRIKHVLAAVGLLSVLIATNGESAFARTQGDFNLSNRFSVEIDGVVVRGITAVDGLESESVVEYKDGEDGVSHTRPGNHKPGKLVVSRDWSNTAEWYKWRKAALDEAVTGMPAARRSISVIFHNDAGEEAGRMNFYNCWPSAYRREGFETKGRDLMTESLDLRFDRVEMK
jgi:phage tail-like protein